MKITAIVVTRGDVDLTRILASLSWADETIVWDNSERQDLSVYGRYEAISAALGDIIAVQDDDCLVSWEALLDAYRPGERLCNMDEGKQREYGHSSLLGWGALFPREDPFRAFLRYATRFDTTGERFRATCDVVFSTLAPFRRVDLGREDLPWWNAPNRMHVGRQGHYEERAEVTAECLSLKRLSVVMPTTGRETLQAAVDSARDADELVVVADGITELEFIEPHHKAKVLFVQGRGRNGGDIGYTAREAGIRAATGTHLAFMDDDDVYTAGAIDKMRDAATDHPVVFKMDDPLHGVIWRDSVLRYANVSSQMFVVPNLDLGTWKPYEHDPGKGGDFVFLRGCVEKQGDPDWREDVVCVIRPHERRSVAIVTPWLNHRELADDYLAALALGPDPTEVIVVDNASDPPLEFSEVRSDENLGFAGGSNLGLRVATSEIVVFLNNDIAATEQGWLQRLTSAVQPGVLAGAKLRYDRHGQVDGTSLPYLDGWCLAGMREDLLELGGFDETLEEPAYFSDNDLCLRARAAGFQLREVRVGLIHKTNQTARDDVEQLERAFIANQETFTARARELLGVAA